MMWMKSKTKWRRDLKSMGWAVLSGDYTSKQKQYLDMLNKGEIKNPKNQTLEFFKIAKDNDGKYYFWPDEK